MTSADESGATPPAMGEPSSPLTAIYCPSCGYDMAGLTRSREVMCPECGRYLDEGELVPRPVFPRLSKFMLRLALPHAIGVVGIVVIAGLCMLMPQDASLVAAAIVACYLPVATSFMGAVDAVSYYAGFARREGQRRYGLAAFVVSLLGGVLEFGVAFAMARVVA
ncbi:MAG: hypothetical protein JNL50_14365 [Phycisphaerae bacterium]|nr:hypothetical protein [Phycisphaerae bacterium]